MLTRELTNFWFFKYFQLAVGAVLGGVIYAIVKSKDVFNFHIDFDLSKDNENAILLTLLLIIIVVFGFLVIFTFLGCCGAACQNQCMLGSFIIILFIFLGANVAVATKFNFPEDFLGVQLYVADVVLKIEHCLSRILFGS